MYRLMNEVTNENNNNRSTSINAEKCSLGNHKSRHIRSLISSTIVKVVNEEPIDDLTNNRSNSLSDKRPFPFGRCRVCTDKATGAHYGIPTCEGCKGFFKRSILRKEKYRCYFGDKCIVNTDNRNRCKSCRFQKCLKEGMSVEGVRMGRIPKIVKEKALAEHRLSTSSTENEDPRSPIPSFFSPYTRSTNHTIPDIDSCDELLSVNDLDSLTTECSDSFPADLEDQFSHHVLDRIESLITKLSQPIPSVELNHEQSLFVRYLRWKMIHLSNIYNGGINQFIERMRNMIYLGVTDFPSDRSSLQDILSGLADAIPFHVTNLIKFAREMPAINELELDDFHKIMNNRLFDFWLIKHASLIQNKESYIMLPNGLQYTRQWMNKVIGEVMVDKIFEFSEKFNALRLTQDEYSLVFPAVICSKDETLDDQETVRHIQYCYLYALYTQMSSTRTQTEARRLFHNLLQIFALLPILNALQEKQFDSLSPEWMDFDS